MDWDAPQIRCLVALNELIALDHTVRERLAKSTREHREDFERLVPVLEKLGNDLSDPKARMNATTGHLRRAQAEEVRVLRHSRRNTFAIGFSTFERYLILRCPCARKVDNSLFKGIGDFLGEKRSAQAYFGSESFEKDWKRADCYRVARNKITHQAGYISEDLKPHERNAFEMLEANKSWGVFLDPVEGVEGEREIVVLASKLGDILSFFQRFAMEIDAAIEGKTPCFT